MDILLGNRTAESAARSFERMNTPAIRATLPLKARTAEEAAADFHASQLPGRHVGDVWCYCIDPAGAPSAMVSCCVFEPELWGQGIASKALALFLPEAAQRYALRTVGAFTFSSNLSSIRVLGKSGFHLMEEFVENGVSSQYYLLDLEQEKR